MFGLHCFRFWKQFLHCYFHRSMKCSTFFMYRVLIRYNMVNNLCVCFSFLYLFCFFLIEMDCIINFLSWSLVLSLVTSRKNYNYHTYSPYYQYSKLRNIRSIRQITDDAMMGDQPDSGWVFHNLVYIHFVQGFHIRNPQIDLNFRGATTRDRGKRWESKI